MFYFGHGDNQDELLRAAQQSDHTIAFLVGGALILVGLVLLSRYYALRSRSGSSKKK